MVRNDRDEKMKKIILPLILATKLLYADITTYLKVSFADSLGYKPGYGIVTEYKEKYKEFGIKILGEAGME